MAEFLEGLRTPAEVIGSKNITDFSSHGGKGRIAGLRRGLRRCVSSIQLAQFNWLELWAKNIL